MKRNYAILVVLLLVIAAVLVYRRPWFAQEAPSATPQQSITVANIGIFSVLNLIAQENGYFATNGLDAKIDEYDSGATSIEALFSGRADMAIAADFVGVINMFEHQDLRVVAQVSDHDVFRLIARRDKGISRPADLKGKAIGLTKKTAGEFYLGRFLTVNQLSLTDVRLVDLSPAEMVSRIENGTIDAVLIFEPHAYQIQETLGNLAVTWSAQGDQRALGLVYALNSFLERHPDLAQNYLRALYQSDRYVEQDKAQAEIVSTSLLNYDAAYMDYLWPHFIVGVDLNQDMLLTMEEQAKWIIDNRLTTATRVPNYLEYIYFPALEQVRPEAVTIIH